MSVILCLETSTKNCSVALTDGEKLLSLREDGSDGYTHAEKLNLFIEEVLKDAGFGYADLNAVAVSEGPGSYTGLRIGVSTAKGLAYALGIELIAINPLEAMATQVADENPQTLLIPMIDARRMEVFCAGFSGSGEPIFPTKAEILQEDSFPEAEGFEQILFFGDGASKAQGCFRERKFEFTEGIEASAKGMMSLSAKKLEMRRVENVAYFEPFYLKDFVAGKKKKPAK